MAKRKPEDPPAGSPAWMSTFSDLMNLLFSKGQDKIKKYLKQHEYVIFSLVVEI